MTTKECKEREKEKMRAAHTQTHEEFEGCDRTLRAHTAVRLGLGPSQARFNGGWGKAQRRKSAVGDAGLN